MFRLITALCFSVCWLWSLFSNFYFDKLNCFYIPVVDDDSLPLKSYAILYIHWTFCLHWLSDDSSKWNKIYSISSPVLVIVCIVSIICWLEDLVEFNMATNHISINEQVLRLKGKFFYDFFENQFSFKLKEIIRLQIYSSPYPLLYSNQQFLDSVHMKYHDSPILTNKWLAAFHRFDDTGAVKACIQYNADQLMSGLR